MYTQLILDKARQCNGEKTVLLTNGDKTTKHPQAKNEFGPMPLLSQYIKLT